MCIQVVHNGPNDTPVIITHNVKKEILLNLGKKDTKDNVNDRYESKSERITVVEDEDILVIKNGPMNILDKDREITKQIGILFMVCFVVCSSDSSLNITKYIGS